MSVDNDTPRLDAMSTRRAVRFIHDDCVVADGPGNDWGAGFGAGSYDPSDEQSDASTDAAIEPWPVREGGQPQ